jgi:micrococcal nuclease
MVRFLARGSCNEGMQVMNLNFAVVLMVALGVFAQPAFAIEKCGSGKRVTCVVDGDTFWLNGEKIRVQGYDTPETTTNICGGNREVRLGHKASDRLTQLLNSGGVSLQRNGKDRYGRTLADVSVDGVDVGDTLIAEGLARSWPDGREFWCD